MLKSILNLENVQKLTKSELKTIQGSEKKPRCLAPLQYCSDDRVYDLCLPISATNFPCS